jgi:hypothetical protein
MVSEKCESCRRAFFQSGGYMPCSCIKEAKPEFVEPPPLIPWNDTGLKVIHPWFYRASIYFAIGVMVGITGCLYATSHIS